MSNDKKNTLPNPCNFSALELDAVKAVIMAAVDVIESQVPPMAGLSARQTVAVLADMLHVIACEECAQGIAHETLPAAFKTNERKSLIEDAPSYMDNVDRLNWNGSGN